MKKFMLLALIFTAFAALVFANEAQQCCVVPKTSVDLGRIQSLAGKWEGTSQDKKQGTNPATVEYKSTSGGSAVVETLFAGTPKEMTSMYYDKGGKLQMTHYCMLGNQPQLELKNSTDNKMDFEMSPESHASLKGQMHMHSLSLEWHGKDELVQTWTGMDADGKPMESTVVTLKRAK